MFQPLDIWIFWAQYFETFNLVSNLTIPIKINGRSGSNLLSHSVLSLTLLHFSAGSHLFPYLLWDGFYTKRTSDGSVLEEKRQWAPYGCRTSIALKGRENVCIDKKSTDSNKSNLGRLSETNYYNFIIFVNPLAFRTTQIYLT